jgi:ribose-phosphate pyrophosphokinase
LKVAHQQCILFSGTSHPALAVEISSLSGIPLGKIDRHVFPDGEISIEILEHVSERDAYVLQSLAFEPNNYLMEMLIIIDALKRSGAASITAVLPYYAYARQDRIDAPGTAIAAKLVADLLTVTGVSHLIVMDLHSEQIEGFFNIPVEHLLSRSLLLSYFTTLGLQNCVVVAPDKGGIKLASAYAKQLGIPLAMIDKVRLDAYRVEMHLFVGDIAGYTVLLPDDMCTTGGTLVSAANICISLGAKRVIAMVSHGLFIGEALEKILASPIELVITTDSVPVRKEVRSHPKIRVLPAAPLFASALRA